jgi:hypothetical protein
MKPVFVGIGLGLVACATALSAVGHYDGVLGASKPEAVYAGDPGNPLTLRLKVLGTPADAHRQLEAYQSRLLIPEHAEPSAGQGDWVFVHIDGMDAEAYLHTTGTGPKVGSHLVMTGSVHSIRPVFDVDVPLTSGHPVLLLEPSEVHPPLIFKR